MTSTRRVAVLFTVAACAHALLVPTPHFAARAPEAAAAAGSRRELLLGGAAAAALLAAAPPSARAAAGGGTQAFSDSEFNIKFEVPSDWSLLNDGREALSEGRRLVLYSSPQTKETNCFLAYTPTRPDYSSLGSFGTLDYVASTIVSNGPGVEGELLASRVDPAGYVYDYTIAVEGQPKRHLKTVFSVVPSGAASMIIAFTAQCRQDDYKAEQAELDRILASYSLGDKKGKK